LSPYIIPGTAFVGIIHHTEKKSAFSSFKPGDSVMALVKSGCNARYMCISRDQLVKVPPKVDPDLAVCLAETYFTAFQALHLGQRTSTRYRDNALQGRSFLIMGGYSSLGRALMELSLAGGADFCYALSKEKQFSAISRLGAIPLSKDPQDWLTLIGKQIGTIITVKDDGLYTEQVTKEHLKTLNNEGRVIVIGQPGVDNAFQISSPSVSKLICKSHRNKLSERSQCYNAFDSLASDPKQSKKDLEHLLALLEQGRLAPEVLERIPLSKVAKAQRIVESKRMSGHIVCTPWTKENLKH
jgi:NADPH:quinone reductase-like Zn-dependent oxidoreductase